MTWGYQRMVHRRIPVRFVDVRSKMIWLFFYPRNLRKGTSKKQETALKLSLEAVLSKANLRSYIPVLQYSTEQWTIHHLYPSISIYLSIYIYIYIYLLDSISFPGDFPIKTLVHCDIMPDASAWHMPGRPQWYSRTASPAASSILPTSEVRRLILNTLALLVAAIHGSSTLYPISPKCINIQRQCITLSTWLL